MFWLVMKSDNVVPAMRGAPYVYRSAVTPDFRISAAARSAIAPPKLCPATMTLLPGCEAAAVLRAPNTPARASTQLFQKPAWAVQEGQISVGVAGKSASATKFRTDMEPRKARTVRDRVLSMAT